MEPVRIEPHHAIQFFQVFYLGWKAEETISWYNNEKMKQNGVNTINRVVSNPQQLVRIANSYDEICRMCPKNKRGDNYDGKETACDIYEKPGPDSGFAKILGLESVMNGDSIIARILFELMKPTYHRLLSEPEYDVYGKKSNLRRIFRISPSISNKLKLP